MDRLAALAAFVRLVELGTFSAVAAELRVKQSTVSKWVAALEEELGAQLVERTTRALRVTDAGQRFYERAKAILGAYDDATAELQAESAELRGRLRVSVPVVFGRRFVVPALSAFLHAHPRLELELVFSDAYINLVDGGFDLAIRVGRPVDSTFKTRTLAHGRRHLVASPAYLEAHGIPEVPGDLEAHACLLHSGLHTGATWVLRPTQNGKPGKPIRAAVRGRIAANHSEALLSMACDGLGIALLASWLVHDELESGRLVPVLPGYALPPAPVQALTPPGRHVHPRVQAFIDAMRDALVVIDEPSA